MQASSIHINLAKHGYANTSIDAPAAAAGAAVLFLLRYNLFNIFYFISFHSYAFALHN